MTTPYEMAIEGYEERVEERVAPMVPEERQNADDEFRPSTVSETESHRQYFTHSSSLVEVLTVGPGDD